MEKATKIERQMCIKDALTLDFEHFTRGTPRIPFFCSEMDLNPI